MVSFSLTRVIKFFAPWNVVWPVLQIIMHHLCFMRNKNSEKCNWHDWGFSIDRFVEGHDTRCTVQTVLVWWVFSCFQNQKSSLQTGNREDIFCCVSCSTLLYKLIVARVWLDWMLKVNLSPVTLISQPVLFISYESTCEIRYCTFSSDCSFVLQEIPAHFNFSSGTEHLNVVSGEQHQVKDRTMRLSQNNRRTSSLKAEQTVSSGLQEASDSHGVNEHVSPVKVTSRRKTQPSTSFSAVHTPAAVCTTGRQSPTVSADHTHDIAKLKINVSSAKKIPKRDTRKSQFKHLMNQSVQSTSAFSIKKDAKISESLLSTPHVQKKSRSVTASCPVVTFQTTGLYSSRKSGKLSEKLSPKSGPNSPLVSLSNTPIYKERTPRKALRFSTLGVQYPESVELSSRSQQTEGKDRSVAPSTSTSKVTASVNKSRTPRVT